MDDEHIPLTVVIDGRCGSIVGIIHKKGYQTIYKVKFDATDWENWDETAFLHDRKTVHYYCIDGKTVSLADDYRTWI